MRTPQLLDKADLKVRAMMLSTDATVGVVKVFQVLMELTGIQRCGTCRRYFKDIRGHKNLHLKFT